MISEFIADVAITSNFFKRVIVNATATFIKREVGDSRIFLQVMLLGFGFWTSLMYVSALIAIT